MNPPRVTLAIDRNEGEGEDALVYVRADTASEVPLASSDSRMDTTVNKLAHSLRRNLSSLKHKAMPARFRKRNIGLAASIFMASCEGTITTDLATEVPADPNISQVVVPFLGVEFSRSDGGTERIELRDAEAIDLVDFTLGEPVRLLTDEELPEGTYTGVRLLFDTDDTDNSYVIDGIGSQRTLTFQDGDYAEMDFTVEEGESATEALTLMLDLRLSLSVDDDDDYQLLPLLRAVRTDELSEIQGTVTASCLSENSSASPAVYLFEGEDITPDDYDGEDADPIATAPVLQNGNQFTYSLRVLSQGSYTIAFSCDAEEEDPLTDDDIDFDITQNVDLDEGETLEQDLT